MRNLAWLRHWVQMWDCAFPCILHVRLMEMILCCAPSCIFCDHVASPGCDTELRWVSSLEEGQTCWEAGRGGPQLCVLHHVSAGHILRNSIDQCLGNRNPVWPLNLNLGEALVNKLWKRKLPSWTLDTAGRDSLTPGACGWSACQEATWVVSRITKGPGPLRPWSPLQQLSDVKILCVWTSGYSWTALCLLSLGEALGLCTGSGGGVWVLWKKEAAADSREFGPTQNCKRT